MTTHGHGTSPGRVARAAARTVLAWTPALWLALGVLAGTASTARADGPGFIHVVRPTETLASIAQHYYGDARRESVLVAENGLTTQGGVRIVVGLRLTIPWVAYHRVQPGETWAQIAAEHYGDPRRASALIDANSQMAGPQPDEGAELLVPYPLRHVARQSDTMRRIAALYYGDPTEATQLHRFNSGSPRRLARGQIILVPLADLQLSDDGRRAIEEATNRPITGGQVRAQQTHINDQLPTLREHVRRGRFTQAVALGNHLLGAGELTGNQVVTIHRELGVAYVALDQVELAVQAFLTALGRQPDLELDSRRTSPTVLAAMATARERHQARAAEPSVRGPDGGTGSPGADAGAHGEP